MLPQCNIILLDTQQPLMPQNVVITDRGSHWAEVHWVPMTSDYHESYMIEYRDLNQEETYEQTERFFTEGEGEEREYASVLTDLSPGVSYSVLVVAYNTLGRNRSESTLFTTSESGERYSIL